MAERKRNPPRIPDPPPMNARFASRDQTAGLFDKPLSWLIRIRAEDPSFPEPILIGDSPRWLIADLQAWAKKQPRGRTNRGGSRPSNFGRTK
jgi:hypothetical protein